MIDTGQINKDQSYSTKPPFFCNKYKIGIFLLSILIIFFILDIKAFCSMLIGIYLSFNILMTAINFCLIHLSHLFFLSSNLLGIDNPAHLVYGILALFTGIYLYKEVSYKKNNANRYPSLLMTKADKKKVIHHHLLRNAFFVMTFISLFILINHCFTEIISTYLFSTMVQPGVDEMFKVDLAEHLVSALNYNAHLINLPEHVFTRYDSVANAVYQEILPANHPAMIAFQEKAVKILDLHKYSYRFNSILMASLFGFISIRMMTKSFFTCKNIQVTS